MKFEDLEKKLRKQIKTELKARGISHRELNPEEIELKKRKNNIEIKYKEIEITIPAPSQEAIDSWWKNAGMCIVGGLIALAGVVVSGILKNDKDD